MLYAAFSSAIVGGAAEGGVPARGAVNPVETTPPRIPLTTLQAARTVYIVTTTSRPPPPFPNEHGTTDNSPQLVTGWNIFYPSHASPTLSVMLAASLRNTDTSSGLTLPRPSSVAPTLYTRSYICTTGVARTL